MSLLQDELFDFYHRDSKLLAFKEMPLGSVQHSPGTQRADVVTMTKSYNMRIRIYEVKSTRADFLSDVGRGKYEGYFKFCHQLFFATPKGLVKKDEIPQGCGLITFTQGRGWHVAMGAPVRQCVLDVEFLMACLFRGQEYAQEVRNLRDRISMEDNIQVSEMAKNVDYRIKRRLQGVEPELEQVRKAQALIDEFLGKNSRSLQDAFWQLDRFLKYDMPGLGNMPAALNLLSLAVALIQSPPNSLTEHGAFKKIQEFVREVAP